MSTIQVRDKWFDLFISEEEIQHNIKKIADLIGADLFDKDPLFVCVLNGAFMFTSDLLKCMNFPCEVTFIRLKSYQGMGTQGKIKEVHGLIEDIEGRNVVIVEDIIDTGYTISYLRNQMLAKYPTSLSVAALLFKPSSLQVDIKPDYVAMEIPADFIVGYGLDYDGHGRNLRDIYKVRG